MCGIARFVQASANWRVLYEERKVNDDLPGWLRKGACDGVLARTHGYRQLSLLRDLDVPIVNLRESPRCPPDVATILSDHAMIARLAADHLIEKNLRHFAFCGYTGVTFSELRWECFQKAVRSRGYKASLFTERDWETGSFPGRAGRNRWKDEAMTAWLQSLPKPVGIMACNDRCGRLVLGACARAGLHVPNEVAVIGVDNDEVICALAIPPMTSVDPSAEHIGFKAAELLNDILDGVVTPEPTILIPPAKVVTRASTDTITIGDPILVQALQFIRDQGGISITTDDILDHLAKSSHLVSRSTLERKFQILLGSSPHDEIVRARLNRVEQLLVGTNYSLERIADIVGMGERQQLVSFFIRHKGITPGAFRKQPSSKLRSPIAPMHEPTSAIEASDGA
jgi:LacI family transcriptional regulator